LINSEKPLKALNPNSLRLKTGKNNRRLFRVEKK